MFECDQCGECCRNLDKSELFNELNRGDGVCKYLSDNLCSIYQDRPLLCRVDDSYDAFFCQTIDRETYYKLNYAVCQQLKQKKERK